jgi:two-component system OmpR family response regulator
MQKHILIVDDEPEIRATLTEVLTYHGYRITSVASAAEAEKAAAEQAPDLVISDLQLEHSDGLILIEQLKKKLPGAKILLLTGVYFEPDVVRNVLAQTVDAYLYKTTPLREIIAAVKKLIG